jgi:GDPmannose 4,6-dehydratase
VAGLSMDEHVLHDPSLVRPAEIRTLCGDSTRARTALNWAPECSFDALVERMVWADLKREGL